MAPADSLSPPGTSSYSSDTLTVGDGTWDFSKNTFLLPNLVGLNFETMRYNGMGNRFSTLTQYHSLILGHGVLAAITFLFIVPFAVLIARFYTHQPGSAVRYHTYLQILAVGFATVVFILGFIAVGPPRNLTNPHHGIGVAIYVLLLLQAVGGRLARKLAGRRSFRMHIHRWFGRAVAILGIVQVPLGLTLYGSPKHLFILYAVWMGFLLFLFFILDYRDHGRREWTRGSYAGGVESSRVSEAKSGGGKMKWLAPLAAVGGLALLRGRKKDRDTERALSRSPTPSGRSRYGRDPEVISSRRASDSYYYDEKQPERRRASGGGGFMGKLFAAGAGLGAGALVSKMMNRRDGRYDDEYSAVATDTPSRVRRYPPRSEFTESEYTERTETDVKRHPSRRDAQSSILPAPRSGPPRPMTPPRRSHPGTSGLDSTVDASDYSSYVSPSRRTPERKTTGGGGGGVAKGLLGGLGLGFLAKMGKDRRDRKEEEWVREAARRREEEEERRAGRRVSRYTGDGYPSPSRRGSRRRSHRPRPPPSGITMTETSVFSDESSIEPRGSTPYDPAPPGARPPPPAVPVPAAPPPPPSSSGAPAAAVPVPMPATVPPAGTTSGQPSRFDVTEPVSMPPMPPDPHGLLHPDMPSDVTYDSPSNQQWRRREGEAAAAEQEEEERRRRAAAASGGGGSTVPGHDHTPPSNPPVSVRVRVHDDRDRNITLRMLTDEEARREQQRRGSRRADSVSSVSGIGGPGGAGPGGGGEDTTPTSGRRYRRDSSRGSRSQSRRRAEAAAEQRVEAGGGGREDDEALLPPNPAFARRAGGGGNKDSAYYSGGTQPVGGPSGSVPAAGATDSSLGGSPGPGFGGAAGGPGGFASPGGSHATFTSGPMSNAETAAADRRRRRRLERRDGSRQATTVDYS
ncbi:hypothetical protein VTK26DRAFT_9365 [Humicola hyalothermophila]